MIHLQVAIAAEHQREYVENFMCRGKFCPPVTISALRILRPFLINLMTASL